jgi:hypothetical protein
MQPITRNNTQIENELKELTGISLMDAANKIRYKEEAAIIGACIKVSDLFLRL